MGDGVVLILLLSGFAFSVASHFPLRKFYFVTSHKAWRDARLYCREHHDDLATYESLEEMNQLVKPSGADDWAWIGLWDDPGSWKGTLGSNPNSWKWATTGQTVSSQYHNWSPGEPNYGTKDQLCVVMDVDGTWKDTNCQSPINFVCFTDVGQNQKTYQYVSTAQTWADAQAYCRQHHTDLPLVLSSEENAAVHAAMPASNTTWLALTRVPWRWSDGTSSTFRSWRSVSPNYPYKQHCAAEDTMHNWDDGDCGVSYHFICHEVRKAKTTIKMKMKTAANLSDAAARDRVLQKLSAAFQIDGWNGAKLKWSVQPEVTQETPP